LLLLLPSRFSADAKGLGPTKDSMTGRRINPWDTPNATVKANWVDNTSKTQVLEPNKTATAKKAEVAPHKTAAPMSAIINTLNSCSVPSQHGNRTVQHCCFTVSKIKICHWELRAVPDRAGSSMHIDGIKRQLPTVANESHWDKHDKNHSRVRVRV